MVQTTRKISKKTQQPKSSVPFGNTGTNVTKGSVNNKSEQKRKRFKEPDKKLLLQMLYNMMQQRSAEERIYELYKEGKIVGGVFSGRGMEAIPVGGASALDENDIIFPLFRDLGAYFVRGMSLRQVFCQYLGRKNGPTRGRDANMHMSDANHRIFGMISHLSAMIPVAAGTALAGRLKNENSCALTFIGDGGTSAGDFHEGLNLASVMKLPLIVIIENNQIAYSTPSDRQYACANLIDRAAGYGIEGSLINGNDILQVYRTIRKAVLVVKNGKGPILIEARTNCVPIHNDGNSKNAIDNGFEKWADKDPIKTFQMHLKKKKYINSQHLIETQNNINLKIEEAVKFAEESPFPDGIEAIDGVYA